MREIYYHKLAKSCILQAHTYPCSTRGVIRAVLVTLPFLFLEGSPSAEDSQKVIKLYSGLPLLLVVEDVGTRSRLRIWLSGKELEDIL